MFTLYIIVILLYLNYTNCFKGMLMRSLASRTSTSTYYDSSLTSNSKFRQLDENVLSIMQSINEQIVPIAGDRDFTHKKGELLPKKPIEFKCDSYMSSSFHTIRSVSFCGSGYDVYNFLVLPRATTNMPILSADIVVLPGGTLAAIDFQPSCDSSSSSSSSSSRDEYYKSGLYDKLSLISSKYQKTLPSGGDLPSHAAHFFSPHAIWTKYDNTDDDSFQITTNAVTDYVQTYVDTFHSLTTTSSSKSSSDIKSTTTTKERRLFQRQYLQYRIDKDPAKKLLIAAFGPTWVDQCLHQSVFPYERVKTRISSSSSSSNDDEVGCRQQDVYFITGNAKKRAEVEDILKKHWDLTISSSSSSSSSSSLESTTTTPTPDVDSWSGAPIRLLTCPLDLPELQGENAVDIAIEKGRMATDILKNTIKNNNNNGVVNDFAVIVEDTSLCFNALGGLPGPYIKWFLDKLGHEGLVTLLAGHEDKSAFAQCIVVYCRYGHEPMAFVGKTDGHIVSPHDDRRKKEEEKKKTFGWDAIFQPAGYTSTYAQMGIEEKNSISHRLKAFRQLAEYLDSQCIVDWGDE